VSDGRIASMVLAVQGPLLAVRKGGVRVRRPWLVERDRVPAFDPETLVNGLKPTG